MKLNFMKLRFMITILGARSPASLVISSVWKPYMKDNCELDDL
ncbi:hypothetical protein HIMB11_03233 [Rhodobacteraceae bacterium HIMB11]|nr:hypothetical protein HIMB11_03233 [Rhodobacteraceae bacterium HIMB11]